MRRFSLKELSNFTKNNFPNTMHLLIAGHGYLGQEVSQQARTSNLKVSTLTRSGEGADFACDLTDRCAVEHLAEQISPTHLLACASSGRGDSEAYRAIFCDGTQHLLAAFPQARLTFISSSSIYRQLDGSMVDEESGTNGATEKSRILAEAEGLTLAQGGTALRLSGIYGPGRSVILKKFLSGEAVLEETAEGLGVRILNQIHLVDAASAILHLMSCQEGGLFNVTDDEPTSQLETYRSLATLLTLPLPPPAPPQETKRGWTNKAVSNRKLRTSGWRAQYPSFLSAIEDLLPTLE